ncbi:glycerol-3-phosphate responsive antiterminator [Brachybacterium subflavum]|uniref:glycerol-3-phosphate responsive antiterminator n=1 Tax=Brachybacterium subflavum TaxID=2585206 RepID=UPI001266835B|nr:glycerol-3-phosphate responsive antiterminator [Brachybacterium subflavum]
MERTARTSDAQMQESLQADPVITTIKDAESLAQALSADHAIVFLLYGSLVDIAQTVATCKAAGKTVLVNIDFIEGLSAQDAAVDWLSEQTGADGVLSSKPAVIRSARRAGLIAVQRYFLVDSISYHQLPRVLKQGDPHFVEILPGCVPRAIEWLRNDISIPIIAGGLVCERKDVIEALSAGALAIATSDQLVWAM